MDGRWKAYVGALTVAQDGQRESYIDNGYVDLIELDLLSGQARTLASSTLYHDGWLVGSQGQVLAHARHDPIKGRWSLHQGRSGGELFAVADPFAVASLLGPGRSPTSAALWLPDEERGARLFELDLQATAPQPQPLEARDHVLYPLHERKTGLLSGLMLSRVPSDALSWPRWLDSAKERRSQAVAASLPGYALSFAAASDDGSYIAFHSQGADDPGSWWLADVGGGKAEELGWSYPGLARRHVCPWRVWRHKASDGLEIEGVLTLPSADASAAGACKKGRALVVLPHGGPASHDRPRFDWWAQALASRGWAVWQPNYRGSTGYGEAFRRAGHGQWGRRMQTDLSDGVQALAAQGLVDAGRVAIVGASYGGYAALAGVTLQQGVYRCAVSVAGVSDLQEMLVRGRFRSGLATQRYWEAYIGAQLGDNKTLSELSPAVQATRADAPVLLMHGQQDTVVPALQSELMARALRGAGKAVELVLWDSEDHWLSLEASRTAMLRTSVAFLMRHNPPC